MVYSDSSCSIEKSVNIQHASVLSGYAKTGVVS